MATLFLILLLSFFGFSEDISSGDTTSQHVVSPSNNWRGAHMPFNAWIGSSFTSFQTDFCSEANSDLTSLSKETCNRVSSFHNLKNAVDSWIQQCSMSSGPSGYSRPCRENVDSMKSLKSLAKGYEKASLACDPGIAIHGSSPGVEGIPRSRGNLYRRPPSER